MPDSVGEQNFLNKLRQRIGTVGAAAAALLAQYSITEANQSAQRQTNSLPVISTLADKRSISRPVAAPLVLTPGRGIQVTLAGGHRSHSSHSSHRSHTSASFRSHSSHYSGSFVPQRSPQVRVTIPTTPSTRARTEPPVNEVEVEQKQVEETKKPAIEYPKVDYSDPVNRFRIVSLAGGSPFNRVTIEDLKEGQKKRLKEGETIGGFKVAKINMKEKSVELAGEDKKSVTIVWKK